MATTRTTGRRRVSTLWKEFMRVGFPDRSVGREVAGVDLMSLDTFTAGCVTTFLAKGKLDLWRTAIMGLCYRDLGVVVLNTKGEERAYFARLEEIAKLVLEGVRNGAKREA